MQHRPEDHAVPATHDLASTVLWLASLPTVPTQDWCAVAASRLAPLAGRSWRAVALGTLDPREPRFRIESLGDAPMGQRPGVFRDTPPEHQIASTPLASTEIPRPGVLGRASRMMPRLAGDTDPWIGIAPLDIKIEHAAIMLVSHPTHEGAIAPDHLAAALAVLAHRASRAFAAHTGTILWLTEREHEVLTLLIEGHSVRAIADTLRRSPHTVHDHVKSLHRKLDASSRGELIAKALGHTDPSEPPRLNTPTILHDGPAPHAGPGAVAELKPAAAQRVADPDD